MSLARRVMATSLLLAASVVGAQADTIFSDNFEATTWKADWVRSGLATWRTNLSTTYKYAGTRGVAMDSSTSGTYATNRLDLKLGLTGYSGVELTFRFRNVGDESHSTDGLYYSNDDGATWSKLTWTMPAISTT